MVRQILVALKAKPIVAPHQRIVPFVFDVTRDATGGLSRFGRVDQLRFIRLKWVQARQRMMGARIVTVEAGGIRHRFEKPRPTLGSD